MFDPDDPRLDPPCKALCVAVNRLPGLETTESCCGHGKTPFRIWFQASALFDRGFVTLARITCDRYHEGHWRVYLDHTDVNPVAFVLENISVPESCIAYLEADRLASLIETHLSGESMPYNVLKDKWPSLWSTR